MAKRLIGIDFGTSSTFMKVKRYKNDGSVDGGRFDFKPVIFDSGSGSAALPTIIQTAGKGSQMHSWYGVEAETLRPGGVLHRNFKVELESYDSQKRAEARALTKQMFLYLFEKYQEQRQFLGEADDTEETVVSYPAKWSEDTQRFMVETARQAGFPHVRGTDEATASINAVLVQKQEEMKQIGILNGNHPFLFLVVDMGAGTTDLAVCQYTPGINPQNKVITTWPGDNNPILLGGREIDSRLGGYFVQMLRRNGISEQIAQSIPEQQSEKIKEWKERTLSDALNRGEAITYCSFLVPFYNMLGISPSAFCLDRTEFEGLLSSYLRQFPELIWGCLSNTAKKLPGFTPTDIDMVILTGGNSQWYFVREMLSGIMTKYGDIRLPKITGDKNRLFIMPRPQEIVSLGLVYQPLLKKPNDYQRQSTEYRQPRRAETAYSKQPAHTQQPVHPQKPDYSQQQFRPQQPDRPQHQVHPQQPTASQEPSDSVQDGTIPESPDRLFALGSFYYNKQTEDDYRTAARYFLKAADQGHVIAQSNLAAMYAEGQGVSKNYEQAFAWCKRAAEQGLPMAQYNLARMYILGRGVEQNHVEAKNWLKKAAAQGDKDAARALEELTASEVKSNSIVTGAEKVRLLSRLPAVQATELFLNCNKDADCALETVYKEMVNESNAAFIQRTAFKGEAKKTVNSIIRDTLWDTPMCSPEALNPEISAIFHSAANLLEGEELLFYTNYGSPDKYKNILNYYDVYIFTNLRIVKIRRKAITNRYFKDEELKFQDVSALLQVYLKGNGKIWKVGFTDASGNILLGLTGRLDRWSDHAIRMIYAAYFRYRKQHGYIPYSVTLLTKEI
ncbi:Hsp70 family protein [Blautia schinkii]|nr:Hsp70 family protein [Blautia schinkii]